MLLPSMITAILRLLPSVVTDILRLIGEFRFLPGPSLWVSIEAKGATLRLDGIGSDIVRRVKSGLLQLL